MRKKFSDKQIHILEVAEELIAQKGFEGTSVRDISAKANINVAMISYYFGSKAKMMSQLYEYRLQRAIANFAEFTGTITDGKPEMQMKEIVKYLVSQMFKYNFFYGFITQDLRHNAHLKEDLLVFYQICASKLDEVTKKGLASGVFTFDPKAEELLYIVLGTTLFAIRNRNFVELYVPHKDDAQYLKEAEKQIKATVLLSVFTLLGFVTE